MYKVVFLPDNIIVEAEAGEILMGVALKGNIFMDAPCNGQGTCGKCKVRIVRGTVDAKKNPHLTDSEAEQGYILACSSRVISDITVEVPYSEFSSLHGMRIEALDSEKDQDKITQLVHRATEQGMQLKSRVRKDYVELDVPNLDDCISDWERIKRFLLKTKGYREAFCGLPNLRKIPQLLRESNFKLTITHRPDRKNQTAIINVENGNTSDILYGVAIDVGTTSVAAFLVNLKDLNIISKAAMTNAQIQHGADVINRIIYATKSKGLQELNKAIIQDTINPLLRKMYQEAKIDKDKVIAFTISGNTTMMHLLAGVNPDFLRREPYIPAFVEPFDIKASELGLEVNSETPLYLLPSVSSYVGGDITGGVLASFLWSADQKVLFLDLGTNGEIVFGNKDFLLTCACSAGPAFEGGEMSCGMRASGGAIEKIRINRTSFEPVIKTVYDERPQGICGSGIIDTVAEMLRAGIIDRKGRIYKHLTSNRIRFNDYEIGEYVLAFAEEWDIAKDITITEVDLDNFIRAKGAVYSAVATLLNSIGVTYDEIDKILIAGGIGSNIDIANSITIGLFPDLPLEKYEYIGNSSLMGSYLTLISEDAREKVEEIAAKMTYVELSASPVYMTEFISACFLPHTNLELFPTVMENNNNP